MNKSKLKSYAPQARKDFIAAVTARANLLGLSEAGGKLEVAPGERKGDLAIIAGREWPAKVHEQRERLIKHIQTAGFGQTMEAVAYTWFNRFAALRYMEIHDYLDHGHRVLSNRSGGMPEILNHATELELPGYNKAKAVELKLAGNKDGELYKMLLVAQCNALSRAMPFLFERIDDETELLLPDNLLRTDSIVAKLVEVIPEEDWQEVEIIGWLYQFYISEKKDEVIGKVVKSEDIPAATQLFTPNWIVQYLVQNSVGRLWLMANPASTLKSQWPYYIEPAEQTPEVQAQLDALIQTRIQQDSPRPQAGEGLGERAVGATLNPETITMLDPACGSGHILVVGYDVFKAINLEEVAELKVGMATSDNERFLRHWHEVALDNVKFNAASHADASKSKKKWFPYSKGGEARKWFGNNYLLVNWGNEGKDVIELATKLWGSPSKRIYNSKYFFKPAITWSLTSSSSGGFCARWRHEGFIFDVNGMSSFVDGNPGKVLCAVNSKVGAYVLSVINPTMAFQAGDLARFPYLNIGRDDALNEISLKAIQFSKADWDSFETSWDFSVLDLIQNQTCEISLDSAWNQCRVDRDVRVDDLRTLEVENNRIFIEAYGLQDELSPEVPEDQITLARADRVKDCQRLISYAIGCMMGRYSLDEPGLIYAHAGNVGFDATRYPTFPADGIVPLTDELWFEDDAANRIREFLLAVWGAETLEENLAWLAESLGKKGNETPIETIRRYLSGSFYKDHLQTYKKRPIYWLFSSGKQGAFQALVYLHRYHEGTLARMRSEYVVPLTGKIQSRIEMLTKDTEVPTISTAARNKLNKEIEALRKKHVELLSYDEKLRHYADMRIQLDLDDGVKVNYGKFGDLLAEVKAITGGASDD